jgi:hypothetical protein
MNRFVSAVCQSPGILRIERLLAETLDSLGGYDGWAAAWSRRLEQLWEDGNTAAASRTLTAFMNLWCSTVFDAARR